MEFPRKVTLSMNSTISGVPYKAGDTPVVEEIDYVELKRLGAIVREADVVVAVSVASEAVSTATQAPKVDGGSKTLFSSKRR